MQSDEKRRTLARRWRKSAENGSGSGDGGDAGERGPRVEVEKGPRDISLPHPPAGKVAHVAPEGYFSSFFSPALAAPSPERRHQALLPSPSPDAAPLRRSVCLFPPLLSSFSRFPRSCLRLLHPRPTLYVYFPFLGYASDGFEPLAIVAQNQFT